MDRIDLSPDIENVIIAFLDPLTDFKKLALCNKYYNGKCSNFSDLIRDLRDLYQYVNKLSNNAIRQATFAANVHFSREKQ